MVYFKLDSILFSEKYLLILTADSYSTNMASSRHRGSLYLLDGYYVPGTVQIQNLK